MDEALGTQFFQSLTSVNGERLDWSPEFRAVEPAQRRAFVELGLYGHSTQLALFTGSVLATETEPDLWAGIENAMDADAFRVPNVEFVPVMYRLCRRGECVGQHWHHLFFPMLLVIANHPQASFKPRTLEQLSSAYCTFRSLLVHLESYSKCSAALAGIRSALDARFGEPTEQTDPRLESLLDRLGTAESVEVSWSFVRDLLQEIPYLGSTVGLYLACRFGSDTVVPWSRLKGRELIEDLIENSFVPLADQAGLETELTHRESVVREAFLAERRAG